jgi:enoyl-CoA hydratase/carnithine racemase
MNNIQKSNILHKGLQSLRSNLSSRRLSTLLNSPDSKVLLESHSSQVFEFKLNHNKTLNAVDRDMLTILEQQLREWASGDAPRVAMISGTGGKAFCAGGDIVSLYNAKKGDGDPNVLQEFFRQEYRVDYQLSKMKPLQVSIWNGIVMGGGVGVSVHAPIRIATDNSVYAMPETGIGLFTDVGASYFLSRVNNNINLGLYLGLTGHRLKAKDLVRWGVATHFVPADKIDAMKQDLVENVTSDSTDNFIESIISKH